MLAKKSTIIFTRISLPLALLISFPFFPSIGQGDQVFPRENAIVKEDFKNAVTKYRLKEMITVLIQRGWTVYSVPFKM